MQEKLKTLEEKICAIPECNKRSISRGRNKSGEKSFARFCRFHQKGGGKDERKKWSIENPSKESLKKLNNKE